MARIQLSLASKRISSPAVLATIYAIFILLGAVALRLPWSNHGDDTLSDALFTPMSAVTVTGLIVVDTGSAYSLVGQVIIALLVQIGGLGLMTFAALLLSMLGLTIGMPRRLVLRDELGQTGVSELMALVRVVVIVAFAAEAVATAVLMTVFVPQFGWTHGLWQTLFHAISAFNNAGFSLFPDSLMGYVGDPTVNITITVLFILSGLGFVVLADVNRQPQWSNLSFHGKLMLSGTLCLILFAWVMFAILEWNNHATLANLESDAARLLASWFQAVTPRTAGLNTLDYAAMEDSTTVITMALMLVGGGPSSTAGGIKVTTRIVLALATLAFFRQQGRLQIFGSGPGISEIMKVLALTSIFLILIGLFLTSLIYQGDFLDLPFEVCSAFGTVGLSRGATGGLDECGRMMIILIMFVGPLGPLTLAFFLMSRVKPKAGYPEGKVYFE